MLDILFDMVINVPAPRVNPKGILMCEKTTLTSLNILRVSWRVHISDDARGKIGQCIHAFQVCPDAFTLVVGRAFQETLGSHQGIHFEVVRVEFGCVTREHARHDRRSCESVKDTNLFVTKDLDDCFFDKVEQLAFVAQVGEHRL